SACGETEAVDGHPPHVKGDELAYLDWRDCDSCARRICDGGLGRVGRCLTGPSSESLIRSSGSEVAGPQAWHDQIGDQERIRHVHQRSLCMPSEGIEVPV